MNTKRIAGIILASCLMPLSATTAKTQGNVDGDGDTYPNVVTMSRPPKAYGGCWYARGGSNTYDIINANVDAFGNGTYPHDVQRLMVNIQKVLDGQRWVMTGDMQGAFDFSSEEITGNLEEGGQGMEQSKLKELHGDLYFYTNDWAGDVEEGTPYWHDANHTPDCLDDRFYADRYLIKACHTNNPLDDVKDDGNNLGKYLFAYKYIEASETYDMASGQMIAYIDNLDTRSSDMGITASADVDADGRPNENVNVHFNWESTFMRDLLNRAGRYAERNAGTLDGYSQATDNPFMAHVHLNIWGDALTGTNDRIPVRLENPDFCIRPLRPISVEFKTPGQSMSIYACDDAVAGMASCTITYKDMFRNQTGSPYPRIFPMDWRTYTNVANNAEWIGFYQGYNDGTNNLWNTTAWNQSQEADRADIAQNYFKPVQTPENPKAWNADNVVPDIGHMLINIGGSEGFLADRASQLGLKMSHTYNDNGNIISTTFEYLNDGITRSGFDIIIPITLKYAWGDITTTGHWEQTAELPHTAAQYYHNQNMNYVKLHFNPTVGN